MYDLDFGKKGRLKLHIRKFLIFPDYLQSNAVHLPPHIFWDHCKFKENNEEIVPEQRGIYCFVVQPEYLYPNFISLKYLFYVGKTNRTLRERYVEYLNDFKGKGKPRPKVYEMLRLYQRVLEFYFAPLNSEEEVNDYEEMLLNAFVPHVNVSIPNAKINQELMYIYE